MSASFLAKVKPIPLLASNGGSAPSTIADCTILPKRYMILLLLLFLNFIKDKLTETLRYSGGRVGGYTENVVFDDEVLATHALVVKVVCHFVGSKCLLLYSSICKTEFRYTQGNILEAFAANHNFVGKTIFCVCDNCKTNVAVHRNLVNLTNILLKLLTMIFFCF